MRQGFEELAVSIEGLKRTVEIMKMESKKEKKQVKK
jgi:hypothetical protein